MTERRIPGMPKDSHPFPEGLAERLHQHTLLEHGTLTEQYEALVAAILDAFQSPEKWPVTDDERCQLLKNLYRRALVAAETKRVTPQSTNP